MSPKCAAIAYGRVTVAPRAAPQWNSGEVKGLRARGGFVVDMRWEEGELTGVKIRADKAGNAGYGPVHRWS